jgi:hypothetical protein
MFRKRDGMRSVSDFLRHGTVPDDFGSHRCSDRWTACMRMSLWPFFDSYTGTHRAFHREQIAVSFTLITEWLADRFGYKPLMALGFTIGFARLIMTAFATKLVSSQLALRSIACDINLQSRARPQVVSFVSHSRSNIRSSASLPGLML